MSSFLYFSEELTKPVQLADCQRLGLGYAFDANPASMDITGRTPTGGRGWLFFDGKRIGNAFQGYKAEFQTWRKLPNSEVWVGFDNAKRPTPQSLARKELVPGELVMLADGQAWQIPRTKLYAGEAGFQSALARYIDVDDNGVWVEGAVKGGHDKLPEVADRLVDGMIWAQVDDTIPGLTLLELADIAAALLGANYHLSAVELGLLQLVTTDEVLVSIAKSSVDYETAMEWLLKKNGANV
jgi:hypothetical protein